MEFGKEIIFDKRVISILDDYQAFKETAYYKVYYRIILENSNLENLISVELNICNHELFILLSRTGLDESKVREFINILSIIYHHREEVSKDTDKICLNNGITEKEDLSKGVHHTISKAIFMGIPIGSRKSEFESVLNSLGYTTYSNVNNQFKCIIKDFILSLDAKVTFYYQTWTEVVTKIRVEILRGRINSDDISCLKRKIYQSFLSYYGNSVERNDSLGLYLWTFTCSEVYIKSESNQVVIYYNLLLGYGHTYKSEFDVNNRIEKTKNNEPQKFGCNNDLTFFDVPIGSTKNEFEQRLNALGIITLQRRNSISCFVRNFIISHDAEATLFYTSKTEVVYAISFILNIRIATPNNISNLSRRIFNRLQSMYDVKVLEVKSDGTYLLYLSMSMINIQATQTKIIINYKLNAS